MVTGILLDVDGTIVLSNDAHAQAWVDAYREFGFDISYTQIRPLIGMGADKVFQKLSPEIIPDEGLGKQLSQRRSKIFLEKYAPSLKPVPGARELVQWLMTHQIEVMAATSSKDNEVKILLRAAKVEDLISQWTTASEVSESKPAPDIIEAGLEKLQMSKDEVLLLGDTPYDLQAAKKAGVGMIAFRSGGFGDDQLSSALAIYDHALDLVKNIQSSPVCRE